MEGKLIYQQIPKLMRSIGVVGKGRTNSSQNYQFRGIDDLYNAVQEALIEHGVFIVPAVVEQAREERQTRSGANMIYTVLTVKHTFFASDGSSVEAVTVGEAMDSGDKSANKAMSAAMKYALIEVFSIPTEGDNDTENSSPEVAARKPAAAPKPKTPVASPDQLREMKELLQVVRLPNGMVEKWFAKAKVDAWPDMPAETMVKCLEFVKSKLPGNVAAA